MYRHIFTGIMQKYLLLDTIASYITFFVRAEGVSNYQSN